MECSMTSLAGMFHAIFAAAFFSAASHALAAPPTACTPIANAASLLHPGALVLLGEMHGTQESPRFTADLVCAAATSGPVILGLEIPRDEQSRIDGYLASKGSAGERARILAGAFWTRPMQDGRSSEAMFGLIERMRGLRARGRDVRVVALDRAAGDPSNRDEAMAARLRETKAVAPKAIVIALNGNFHNSLAPDGATAPMGARLRDLDPVALTVAYSGGNLWMCDTSCGLHAIKGSDTNTAVWSIELVPVSMGDRRWNGVFHVGALHVSPPAVPAPRTPDSGTSATPDR